MKSTTTSTKLAFSLLGGLLGFGSMAHAQAPTNVTLYGIVDSGVEISNHGNGTRSRLISGGQYGSRWGLRGSEDLGNGLSAVFRLENGFNTDDGTAGQGGRLFGREASVGLSSKSLGTVTLGRIPTPYYWNVQYLDAFTYGQTGGFAALTRSGTTVQQVLPLVITARADNAVNYTSPTIAGFEARAQFAMGENSATTGRSAGASLRYLQGPLDLVVAFGRQNGGVGDAGKVRSYAVGGSYDFSVAKLYAGFTDEKNNCSTCTGSLARATGVGGTNASEFRLINVGTRIPFGSVVAIAQVARVLDRSVYTVDPGNRNATWLAVGMEYSLSKRTAVYASVGTIGNADGSSYALGTAGAQQPANTVAAGDPRAKTAALGLRHSF